MYLGKKDFLGSCIFYKVFEQNCFFMDMIVSQSFKVYYIEIFF